MQRDTQKQEIHKNRTSKKIKVALRKAEKKSEYFQKKEKQQTKTKWWT